MNERPIEQLQADIARREYWLALVQKRPIYVTEYTERLLAEDRVELARRIGIVGEPLRGHPDDPIGSKIKTRLP